MSRKEFRQIAAIMACAWRAAGILPVNVITFLEADGSGLFLAGPALVQAAIGQKYSR